MISASVIGFDVKQNPKIRWVLDPGGVRGGGGESGTWFLIQWIGKFYRAIFSFVNIERPVKWCYYWCCLQERIITGGEA